MTVCTKRTPRSGQCRCSSAAAVAALQRPDATSRLRRNQKTDPSALSIRVDLDVVAELLRRRGFDGLQTASRPRAPQFLRVPRSLAEAPDHPPWRPQPRWYEHTSTSPAVAPTVHDATHQAVERAKATVQALIARAQYRRAEAVLDVRCPARPPGLLRRQSPGAASNARAAAPVAAAQMNGSEAAALG